MINAIEKRKTRGWGVMRGGSHYFIVVKNPLYSGQVVKEPLIK